MRPEPAESSAVISERLEEFYSLLIKPYNKKLSESYQESPERVWPYHDNDLPGYWQVLAEQLMPFDRASSIFEVGSGLGDVLTLLHWLGFSNISGIERDAYVADLANQKLSVICNNPNAVIAGNYPIDIPSPDILLQINCVYFEGMTKKQQFIDQLLLFYENALPKHYFLEVIDNSFTAPSTAFPDFIRLSEKDIQQAFAGLKIRSYQTYQYPRNTSSKKLYIISQ